MTIQEKKQHPNYKAMCECFGEECVTPEMMEELCNGLEDGEDGENNG